MSVFQVLQGLAVIDFVMGTRIVIRGKVVTTFQVPTSATVIRHQPILVLVIYRPLARRVALVMLIASSARVISPFPASLVAIATRIVLVLVLVTAPALVTGAAHVTQIVQVERAPAIQRHLVKAIAPATVIVQPLPVVPAIRPIIVMKGAKLVTQNAPAFVMRLLIAREIALVTSIVHEMSSALAM
jgi:hypothetical protein